MSISLDKPRFKRILLKMSGEALMGEQQFGLDSNVVNRIAKEIKVLNDNGVEVASITCKLSANTFL